MPIKSKSRVLFILKRREDYSQDPSYSKQGVSTGLWNSARLVCEMLNRNDIDSKLVEVIDNNCIDKEVTAYKPTHVIIEALWVVPDKFAILSKLHPTVKWVIRLHSETPFMANEGIAYEWIRDYLKYPNVILSANAKRMLQEVRFLVKEQHGLSEKEAKEKVIFLSNYYYPQNMHIPKIPKDHSIINVGCFGAIRPLKNHMIQAIAALMFAKKLGRKLHFHINTGRNEMKGDPILKNLISMFEGLKDAGHVLHLHQWMPHPEFLEVVKTMDIGLQVSFTETFNIVSADLAACNIPIVVSEEVMWAVPFYASPTSSKDIVKKLEITWFFKKLFAAANKVLLRIYSMCSEKLWVKYFR